MISNNLSDSSKVWIYQSNRPFTAIETIEINEMAQQFLKGWNAHGSALTASIDLIYDRFIVIMVDENHAQASGCSIDSSVGFIKKIAQQYQVDLLDRITVAYLYNNEVKVFPLAEMQELINTNKINHDTIVFNNLVTTKVDFINYWQTPIKNSWHAKMLKNQWAIN